MLYAIAKSDMARLDELGRFVGLEKSLSAANIHILELTNQIWRSNTTPSHFISDSMVATWVRDERLQKNIPDLFDEENQYALLGWYCCARPFESGCRLSREPVDPILARMAHEPVAASGYARLPYTALMMSVYHYRRDTRDAVSLVAADGGASFLGWYYCHGIRELGLLHHVTAEERDALNGKGDNLGQDGIAPLLRFALEWLPNPNFDLTTAEGRLSARTWFFEVADDTQPFASLWEGPQVSASETRDDQAEPVNGLSSAAIRMSAQRLNWRIAEYFDREGDGGRLLLQGEWYSLEDTFAWSRAPLASLTFELPEPVYPGEGLNFGVLLYVGNECELQPDRSLCIYLNGATIWAGLVSDAAAGELVMRLAGENIRFPSVNLLQFQLSEAFVPADLIAGSDDGRRLGIALRRIWMEKRPGLRPPPPRKMLAKRTGASTTGDSPRLIVLRGDLRSHTGYGKEARALAALVPEQFRVLGVDIHPDPDDDQAQFPHPILPEDEAAEQVISDPLKAIVIHCCGPDDFVAWPNAHNVGWPSWETETVPYRRQWPLRLGLMDAIWAKTTFMREFVRRAGYEGPVQGVPWPHDFAGEAKSSVGSAEVRAYYRENSWRGWREHSIQALRAQARYLFLAVQSLAPRKGLPLLLREWRTYVEGPGGDDILLLRLAFRHAEGLGNDWREIFGDALATAGFGAMARTGIAVMPVPVSEAELANLYRTADAYISMSYGEGFGGPIVEALRNECLVIAPRHTGLRDLLPPDYRLTVGSERMTVALKGNLSVYPHSASWHIPKPGQLQAKLGEFASMTATERQALLAACRKHAMSFCWAPIVRQRLAAAIDDVLAVDAIRSSDVTSKVNSTAEAFVYAGD